MKNSLSLTLIAKNEEKHIPRVLENAHIFADEIVVVVDTDSTDNTKKEARRFTNKVFDFEWHDDFSEARNFGIGKCTKDFIMWVDADDIITLEDARKIKKLKENKIEWDVAFLPWHYHIDENGNTLTLLRRERIFRNFSDIWFEYPIHECLKWPPKTLKFEFIDDINIYHKNIFRWRSSNERNLQMLLKNIKLKKYKEDIRILLLLAREYSGLYHHKKSISILKKVLSKINTHDFSLLSEVYFDLGTQFANLKNYNKALEALSRSMVFYPFWREPFFETGKILWELGKYNEALKIFLIAKTIPPPKDKIINPMIYDGYIFYDYLSLAYDRIGDYQNALVNVQKALQFLPNDERLLENEKYYLSKLRKIQASEPPNPRNQLIKSFKKMFSRLNRIRNNTFILDIIEQNNGMINTEQAINIYHLLSQVILLKIPGDIVELGCHEGFTSILMQKTLDQFNCNKTIHVYDSFEGLPDKSIKDEPTLFEKGWGKIAKEKLIQNFNNFKVKPPVIHVGWFKDTLLKELPKKICFVHLDSDFYSSTKEGLEYIYPRLSKGAIVVIDDYCDPKIYNVHNILPGVKKACDEFFKDKKEKVNVLISGNQSHGYFRKE